jgi:hypothetical protein
MSLKLALQQLGFDPCYHMINVMRTQDAAEHWAAAAAGEKVDWDVVFAGYRAAVDWPACDYWRELMVHAPPAKVILSVRDPDSWFRSTQDTIFGTQFKRMSDGETAVARMVRAITARHFDGSHTDRAALIAGMKAHNTAVRRDVPAERLLEFNVAEGWEPLCRFLDVPVPDTPFPRVNTTDEFRGRMASH